MEKDIYKTILTTSDEVLFKDRGSKFFGYAFPVDSEKEISTHIDSLKKKHASARHWCYAWQLGEAYDRFRANDDGEPGNSAGMPIYAAIQSLKLTNVLVVVVRYFGGTKLGVGGLINAYRSTAKLALENSKIIERTIDFPLYLTFDYPEMNSIMRIVKEENLRIVEQKLELRCKMKILVRQKDRQRIFSRFSSLHKIKVKSN